MVYVAIVFVSAGRRKSPTALLVARASAPQQGDPGRARPSLSRVSPWLAGTAAILFCWLVEIFQLTGVPAYLSERSLIARLALGVKFDPADMAWYPVGVLPLVAAHFLINRMVASRHPDR